MPNILTVEIKDASPYQKPTNVLSMGMYRTSCLTETQMLNGLVIHKISHEFVFEKK